MKITIKNLKQVTFVVEVPSAESTVLDLKKEIEKSQNFDAEQMKLLFRCNFRQYQKISRL